MQESSGKDRGEARGSHNYASQAAAAGRGHAQAIKNYFAGVESLASECHRNRSPRVLRVALGVVAMQRNALQESLDQV